MDTYIRALAAQEMKVKQEQNTEKKKARNKEALKKVPAGISNIAGVDSWIQFLRIQYPYPALILKKDLFLQLSSFNALFVTRSSTIASFFLVCLCLCVLLSHFSDGKRFSHYYCRLQGVRLS